MNPDDIELRNLSKIFEYERLSRELDECENISSLRQVAKSYIKLHLSTLEIITELKIPIE